MSAEAPKHSKPAEKAYSYTSHNFDSMNRAIDNQIQKQELMSAIYRNQRYENSTRTIFYVVSTICLAALTAGLLWWLIMGPGQGLVAPITGTPSQALIESSSLATLSASETQTGEDADFIDTSFTVFHRNLTEAGDYVVTGKTYTPSELKLPYEQYCYLESATNSGELAARPLASYAGNEYKLETDEDIFVRLAARYCRFTAP